MARNRFGAILKGLLHCVPCCCAMSPTHATKDGTKRYRYYVCMAAQKRGWQTCPSKAIPAGEIERFVVDQIKGIGRDPQLIAETVRQARAQTTSQLDELSAAERRVERDLACCHREVQQLAAERTRIFFIRLSIEVVRPLLGGRHGGGPLHVCQI